MWRLQGTLASCDWAGFSARLDLRSLHDGLRNLTHRDREWNQAALMQIQSLQSLASPLADPAEAYIRGADLVATYAHASESEVVTQVYWRLIADEDLGASGLELIVSLQTDLLDSVAPVAIGSHLAAESILILTDPDRPEFQALQLGAEALTLGAPPGALLVRLRGLQTSYLEMIHPADWAGLQILGGPDPAHVTSRFLMFPEHLEKGVIRRGRLRGLVLPRENDQELGAQCYHRFLASALPLTA